jgi:multiple antibiotic resistance protein
MNLFLFAFGALFSIINPLGTVPVFVSLTGNQSKQAKSRIALRTSRNVLFILLISFFLGKYLLILFGISVNSLKIAGGLIIATSGFALLSGKFNEHKGIKKEKVKRDIETRSEITLTPLAIPMLAGPGTISLLITYKQEYDDLTSVVLIIAAIIATTISIYFILRSSNYIERVLGASGINALSRIIGFIVIAIGVEYVTSALINVLRISGL